MDIEINTEIAGCPCRKLKCKNHGNCQLCRKAHYSKGSRPSCERKEKAAGVRTGTLEAKNVTFQYNSDSRMILQNFNLKMDSNERVGLVAPSGFGKTTFCKILSGYEKPDAGEVYVDGHAVSSYKGYCPVQMIWQHPEHSVNPRLRMQEILAEGDRVEERVIKGLGIEEDWLSRYPAEISGGEMQRFCIARALGERTRFLLADEISTMLDLITQSQIWHFLIEEIERRNIGLLTVSHNDELLQQICTRIYNFEENAIQD